MQEFKYIIVLSSRTSPTVHQYGDSHQKATQKQFLSKQKKGLRAVIPGFINYKYRDGNIPGHTKTFFTEYKILTIQNIITFNALIFMCKICNYRSLLPLSILKTIPDNSPNSEDTHESCENWLSTYNNNHYPKSVFYKGPLLSTDSDVDKICLQQVLQILPCIKII